MNSSSKQRIIGALVLFALALIFFPVIFDLSGERTIDTTSQIPAMPHIEPVAIPEPVRPANIVPPKPNELAFQPSVDPADVADDTPQAPSLNEQGVPESWVIQVGSFKSLDKAQQLSAQLQADGFKSYLKSLSVTKAGSGLTTMHRVFVGPKIRKSNALQEKKRIEDKYQLKTMILKFTP